MDHIEIEHCCPTCGAINVSDQTACFSCGQSLKATQPLPAFDLLLEPQLQQRYRVLEPVGQGGFSAVYKAQDITNQRFVAIKAVSLRGLNATEKIEATDAFNREVQLLSMLSHRSLPHIYEHFADAECWYIVMDFIDGVSLEKHLERQERPSMRLSMEEIFDLGLVLCDVLSYLHTRQPAIIFRDLKPSNIIISPGGRLFLIDFGIARRFTPGQKKDTIPFGSPGYAAPEQYGKAQTTPRSDIYSLGVLLHQLFTGDDPILTPFHFAPIRASNSAVSLELEQLILSMVELDTSKRPENIEQVKYVLQQATHQQRMQRGLSPTSYTPYIYPPNPIPTPVMPPVGASPMMFAPAAGFQVQAMQHQIHGTFNPHWQPQIPTRQNWYALASLMLVPIYFYTSLCSLIGTYSWIYSHNWLWASTLSAIPLLIITGSVILGHIGLNQANTVPGQQTSRGTAVIALIFNYLALFAYALIIILGTWLVLRGPL